MLASATEHGGAGANVIYVGPDICFRTAVIERAGYHVETCVSVDQFGSALRPDIDAVLVSEIEPTFMQHLVSLTHLRSSARTVLFQESAVEAPEANFDLVISSPTPPDRWLPDLASLIDRSRTHRMELARRRQDASALRAESGELRRKSVAERQRTWLEVSKPVADPWLRLFDDEEQ